MFDGLVIHLFFFTSIERLRCRFNSQDKQTKYKPHATRLITYQFLLALDWLAASTSTKPLLLAPPIVEFCTAQIGACDFKRQPCTNGSITTICPWVGTGFGWADRTLLFLTKALKQRQRRTSIVQIMALKTRLTPAYSGPSAHSLITRMEAT